MQNETGVALVKRASHVSRSSGMAADIAPSLSGDQE